MAQNKKFKEVDDVTEVVTICDALRHRQIELKTVRAEKLKDLAYPAFACRIGGDRSRPKVTRNKKKSFMERIKEKLRHWL